MDSTEITPSQAQQIHKTVYEHGDYLNKLLKRMDATGFPKNDPL
jgi:hypothetical protein